MNFIRKFFKSDPEVRNIYHPEVRVKIEYAFSLDGVKYYRYKEDHNMYEMRRFQKIQFLTEYENGLTHDDLISYIHEIKGNVNKGQLGDVALKLELLEQRTKIAKDPDTLFKIATVDFFDENEELTTYDRSYNKRKLEIFKLSKEYSFFLTRPMIDIFPQLASLAFDSVAFSSQIEEMKDLKEKIDSLTFGQSYKKPPTRNTEN
jgi:hypothetical protein